MNAYSGSGTLVSDIDQCQSGMVGSTEGQLACVHGNLSGLGQCLGQRRGLHHHGASIRHGYIRSTLASWNVDARWIVGGVDFGHPFGFKVHQVVL